MHIKIQDENFNAESLAVIAILAAEGEPETVSLDPLRGEMRDFCRRVVVNENFRGEAGKLLRGCAYERVHKPCRYHGHFDAAVQLRYERPDDRPPVEREHFRVIAQLVRVRSALADVRGGFQQYRALPLV